MSKIVRRQREVGEALQLWENLCKGKTTSTLLEIHGIPGIGKTELVKQIKEDLLEEYKGALCAHLDFNPDRNPGCKSYSSDRKTLFNVLLKGWKLSLAAPSEAQIVDEVGRRDPKDPVVLICDETHKIPAELNWFEKELVLPLTLSNRCLVIWVGRKSKPSWSFGSHEPSRPDPKLKVRSLRVETIPDNQVLRACLVERGVPKAEIDQVLAPWIWDITFGHPLAERVAADAYWLHRGKTEDELKKEIAKAIDGQVIRKYVFVGNSFSESDLYLLALMRIADVGLWKSIRPSSSSPLTLQHELQSTTLSGEPLRGFCQETLSKWLSKLYSVVSPDEYVEAQKSLIGGCRKLAGDAIEKRETRNWPRYVVKQLYHSSCVNTVKPGSYDLVKMTEECLKKLNNAPLDNEEKKDLKDKLKNWIYEELEIDSDTLNRIISAIH